MLETYFIDIDGGHVNIVIAIHHETIVGLVAEVGTTVDVVHLHPSPTAIVLVAVHLARVGHEDHQHTVLLGEAYEAVEQRREILQLGLSLLQLLLDAVQRVEHQDTDPTTGHQLTGDGEDVVQRVAVFILGQDVGDIVGQPVSDLLVEFLGHVLGRLEGEARELLGQLALVQDDGHVLWREVGDAPLVTLAEAEHQLVDPLALAFARATGDHHEATGFEGDLLVEVGPTGIGSVLHAVDEERVQLIGGVGSGEGTVHRHLLGSFHTTAHGVGPMAHQLLVGILAPVAPVHHTAALGTQAATELGLQTTAHGIGIHAEGDGDLVVEVALHEAVHPREVGIAAVGHADGGGIAALDQGQGIDLSLADAAGGLTQQGVDIVGDQLRAGSEGELLVERAELLVDELALLPVVERNGELLLALYLMAIGRDVQQPERMEGDAALVVEVRQYGGREVLSLGLPDWAFVLAARATLEVPFLTGFALLFATALLVLVGHKARSLAMVAFVEACVEVDRQGFIGFVAPGFGAPRT